MTDAIDHGRVILAAIIPGRRDLLDTALRRVVPDHFIDPGHKVIYQLLERYAEVTRAILPRAALGQIMRATVDPARIMLYEELWDSFATTAVADSDFAWSVEQIRDLAAERDTIAALTTGMEVLRVGVKDNRGNESRGHEDARSSVLARFAEIDRTLSMREAPEGDMRTEGAEMLKEYALRKTARANGTSAGVRLGVPDIDFKTGGFQPGELILLAGYTGDGKSTICAQGAWSASVEQGRNVVILTTETVRDQFRRKLIARHSTQPIFGLADGINTRDLKAGSVAPEHEMALQAVIADLTTNPAYGRLYIAQVPRGATIATCEARLHRLQRQFHIDMVYIDYLALLSADVRRDADREYLGAIIKEAKRLATTFDGGRGIPIASPWQVNRKAKEYADLHNMYLSEHLAETAEATNSSDIVISILANNSIDARVRDVLMQLLKHRDGETLVASPLRVRVDYATSRFSAAGEAVMARSLDEMVAPPSMDLLGLPAVN